tara:strand:+ start:849 stop:1058 length:210 start_codon:yes stop_codon:yes gene_type:complete
MSQKQKNWVERKLQKIHDKAGDKLISLTKKYVDKIPEDEDESIDLDLFKPDSKAKGGKIVSSYYKGGKT